MEGLGARGQTGKRRNVVRRAKCQFCKDGPLVSAKHYRVHRVHLKAHCYSRGVTPRDEVGSEYGCRHCEVVTFTPGLMMDHLIGSHPAELGPVHGWERVTQHMPPVAEPAAVVSDEATKAFVVQLAEANADLRQGMADLVDGWAEAGSRGGGAKGGCRFRPEARQTGRTSGQAVQRVERKRGRRLLR